MRRYGIGAVLGGVALAGALVATIVGYFAAVEALHLGARAVRWAVRA